MIYCTQLQQSSNLCFDSNLVTNDCCSPAADASCSPAGGTQGDTCGHVRVRGVLGAQRRNISGRNATKMFAAHLLGAMATNCTVGPPPSKNVITNTISRASFHFENS